MKRDAQVRVVQITLKIEQMHFQAVFLAVHRRPRAHIGRARMALEAGAGHPHREHPVQRRHRPLQGQIHRRHIQGAAQLVAVAHAAADRIRATQQALGQAEIPLLQRRAYPRAGHPLAVDFAGRRVGDLKTEPLAGLLQVIEITVTATAETEVIPHHQVVDAQALDQQIAHERLGGEAAERLVEPGAQHLIDAVVAQRDQLVTQAVKPRRCLVRAEKFLRLRFEQHHRGQLATRPGLVDHLIENPLMPQMDAIEVADGGDAAPVARPQIVNAANQSHSALVRFPPGRLYAGTREKRGPIIGIIGASGEV